MKFEIKSWLSGETLFEATCESFKSCVELAAGKEVSLNFADLNGAELNNAELNFAELIRIDGYSYPIIISSTHADVGCEHHTFKEWRRFSKESIIDMYGAEDSKFYLELIRIIDFFRPANKAE